MRRRSMGTTLRRITVLAASAAAIATLAACDRPLPKVTILSGATTVELAPQTYCFDATHCHFPKTTETVVHAAAGSTLLIDVPREVADHPWSVASGTLSGNTLKTFVGDNYSTGAITNSHSARVDVPFGAGTYTLVIRTAQDAWISQVSVKR